MEITSLNIGHNKYSISGSALTQKIKINMNILVGPMDPVHVEVSVSISSWSRVLWYDPHNQYSFN